MGLNKLCQIHSKRSGWGKAAPYILGIGGLGIIRWLVHPAHGTVAIL
jgi:hypothetical protein